MSRNEDQMGHRGLERCCQCGNSSRAGRADDSLYTDDGEGPYCPECWDDKHRRLCPRCGGGGCEAGHEGLSNLPCVKCAGSGVVYVDANP